MKGKGHIGRKHLIPLLVGFVVTVGLVLVMTGSMQLALGVVLGPFAGAVARDWQSCCAENSWNIAPYAVSAVAVALLVQVVIRPDSKTMRCTLATLWWIGCIAWFLAALLSYAHALE